MTRPGTIQQADESCPARGSPSTTLHRPWKLHGGHVQCLQEAEMDCGTPHQPPVRGESDIQQRQADQRTEVTNLQVWSWSWSYPMDNINSILYTSEPHGISKSNREKKCKGAK